jgi:hypothetical protein
LLSLGYAVWAFTTRRRIFQDFADGRSVTIDDAETSDALDTIFLVVAGLIVLIAVGWWLTRMLANTPRGGVLERAGLALVLLGAVVVVIGLVLTGGVTDAADRAAQGANGVTATAVMGGGFALLGVGLVVGLLAAVGQRGGADRSSSTGISPAAPGW